jgi:hypothetical protein
MIEHIVAGKSAGAVIAVFEGLLRRTRKRLNGNETTRGKWVEV